MDLPTLFISHGSPMMAIENTPTHRFLTELGKTLPRPRAILVVSAHWETVGGPAVSVAARPETIHDFGGFPAELYELQYPVSGAPETAAEAALLLEAAGFPVKRSPTRGLDHGAWVPLRLMYPQADIPVTQVSIGHGDSPAHHEQMGSALQDLRNRGVLIIGSGSLTHNLQEYFGRTFTAAVPSWVSEFDEWMYTRLQAKDRKSLLDYRTRAPFAVRNHPTDEHLLPLFVAMGAAGAAAQAQRLHAGYEYGVIAMDTYAFS